jgi:hypothetical protein
VGISLGMLKPAILYKEQILNNFHEKFYTEDMLLVSGDLGNWEPEIPESCDGCNYDYAIVSKNGKLLGYLHYRIDWYSSVAYNFGILSFEKSGNPAVGKDLFIAINRLLDEFHLHKVEWRMISGNPVERSYDRFCKDHGGNKHVLKDSFKDRSGAYRDSIIYEVFSDKN